MAFEKTIPQWNAPGIEPPQSLKDNGFQPGYKPPADYFNWYWYGVSKALEELQGKVATVEDELANTSDIKPVRYVVGTSTNGWTEADCDFLCDGTSDETEIRRALWSVPNEGGEVVLLDGTYNIGATITVNSNGVVLRGNGIGTILARAFDDGILIDFNMVATNCTIRDLCIDGKRATYTDSSNASIGAGGANITVLNNILKDSYQGVKLSGSSCIIANNTCTGNEYGVYASDGENNLIADNILTGNTRDGIGNYGSVKTSITGNVCNGNESHGIYFNSGEQCTISGNTCNGNEYGIYVSYGEFNTFTGNSCNGNTEAGIRIYEDHNNFTGNVCCSNSIGIDVYYSGYNGVTGNTCLANTTCNLRVYGASNNIISGNNLVVASDDSTIPTYALQLTGSDTANNMVIDNLTGTGTVSNAGGSGNIVTNTTPITYGTTDLTAGSSTLATGALYFVYE